MCNSLSENNKLKTKSSTAPGVNLASCHGAGIKVYERSINLNCYCNIGPSKDSYMYLKFDFNKIFHVCDYHLSRDSKIGTYSFYILPKVA